MTSKHADKGKEAEKEAADWLETRSATAVDFAFHRFPDARSARGALAAQPSDFLVIDRGIPTFLEVKETAEMRRFPRSKISQYGALKKMHWAGARIVVLVRRSSSFNDWVVFFAVDLFPGGVSTVPTSFLFPTDRPAYHTAALALERIFE